VPSASRSRELAALARLFLRLGFTAFGGPAAHIALMEDEVVRRRGWLTRDEFLDLLGATNLIPGPNSTEMAIHIGHRRAGYPGLLVAGACFILPAMGMVMALAAVYQQVGQLPVTTAVMDGVKPVVLAVVIQALWGLSRSAIKHTFLGVVGAGALALAALGVDEVLILIGAGAACVARQVVRSGSGSSPTAALAWPLLAPSLAAVPAVATAVPEVTLGAIFLFFAKVGSVLFGSGYVLLAFLRADLVEHWHWLKESQLLDAVAVGQFTPGPVFTTATFIGYLLAGYPGALVATVGIFGPAFFFVAISGPLVPRLRRSPLAGAFLDGVNVASLALMASVLWLLGRSAIVSASAAGILGVSAVLLVRFRVNSAWLILGGGLAGYLLHGGP
jgi:chromate transporter